MILSCPSCATQYAIDEAQLGPAGRTVRCSACKTTWRAERVETPIELAPAALEPAPVKAQDLKAIKAKTLPRSYRALQDYKKRMKAVAAQGLVWGALAAGFILVLTCGYVLRANVVQLFPRAAGAYAMVGLPVNATHLQIISQTGDKHIKGGRFVVTVTAQVRNLADRPVPVPPMKVKLLDNTLQPFDTVIMPAPGLVMAPNAVRTLTFDVPDPKDLSAHLDLNFDLMAMKAMKAASPSTANLAAAAPPASEDVAAAGNETDLPEAPARAQAQIRIPAPALRPAQPMSSPTRYDLARQSPAAGQT
jgi:predicted Zn finger-like uncharacterized protein